MKKSLMFWFCEIKKHFFTMIVTEAILHGQVSTLFGKDEYFYKLTSLYFWFIKICENYCRGQK
jgi:hypothetical protein